MNQSTFPLANREYVVGIEPAGDIVGRLLDDARSLYGRITDIRWAELHELWRLARDLVTAIERWAQGLSQIAGSQKMDIAQAVAWAFIEERGGLDGIRERIADALPVLPRFAGRWLLDRILSEENARGLIRCVLEFAVIELKKLRD